MGIVSLGLMLKTLGLKLLVIEDEVATARTISLRVPVESHQQRFKNNCRQKPAAALEAVEPIKIEAPQARPAAASRAHLRVVQGKRRGSKYG